MIDGQVRPHARPGRMSSKQQNHIACGALCHPDRLVKSGDAEDERNSKTRPRQNLSFRYHNGCALYRDSLFAWMTSYTHRQYPVSIPYVAQVRVREMNVTKCRHDDHTVSKMKKTEHESIEDKGSPVKAKITTTISCIRTWDYAPVSDHGSSYGPSCLRGTGPGPTRETAGLGPGLSEG